MAEVTSVIDASQRLNAVIAKTQKQIADAREIDAKTDQVRATVERQASNAAEIRSQRLDDEQYREDLILQQRLDDEARQRNFDALDAANLDRDLPRGSLVDILA